MNPLWTESDLAAALATTPTKVRRMAERDGMPSIDVPNVGRRYDPVEVDRWLRSRDTNPQPAKAAR